MDFKTEFPDYVAIERFVRQAHLERSLHLAELIAGAIFAMSRALPALVKRGLPPRSRDPWGAHPLSKSTTAPD